MSVPTIPSRCRRLWLGIKRRAPGWPVLLVIPLLLFANLCVPSIAIPSADGAFFYCLQPHFNLLLLCLSLAICFASPLTGRWKLPLRLGVAGLCLILGVVLYVNFHPERIWRARLNRSAAIRVNFGGIASEKFDFLIRDRSQIEALRDSLAFVDKPWQSTHCWCMPSLEFELIDAEHQSIISFGSNHQVMYFRPVVPPDAGRLTWLQSWEHFLDERARLTFHRVLLEAYAANKTSLNLKQRQIVLKNIGGALAYRELSESLSSAGVEERRSLAFLLEFPHPACIQAIKQLTADSDSEVRARAETSLDRMEQLLRNDPAHAQRELETDSVFH